MTITAMRHAALEAFRASIALLALTG